MAQQAFNNAHGNEYNDYEYNDYVKQAARAEHYINAHFHGYGMHVEQPDMAEHDVNAHFHGYGNHTEQMNMAEHDFNAHDNGNYNYVQQQMVERVFNAQHDGFGNYVEQPNLAENQFNAHNNGGNYNYVQQEMAEPVFNAQFHGVANCVDPQVPEQGFNGHVNGYHDHSRQQINKPVFNANVNNINNHRGQPRFRQSLATQFNAYDDYYGAQQGFHQDFNGLHNGGHHRNPQPNPEPVFISYDKFVEQQLREQDFGARANGYNNYVEQRMGVVQLTSRALNFALGQDVPQGISIHGTPWEMPAPSDSGLTMATVEHLAWVAAGRPPPTMPRIPNDDDDVSVLSDVSRPSDQDTDSDEESDDEFDDEYSVTSDDARPQLSEEQTVVHYNGKYFPTPPLLSERSTSRPTPYVAVSIGGR